MTEVCVYDGYTEKLVVKESEIVAHKLNKLKLFQYLVHSKCVFQFP